MRVLIRSFFKLLKEVIVGKSVTDDGDGKCFAYVHTYDNKPSRRLFEFLKSRGVQENHTVRFVTDGEDDVRAVPELLSAESEHMVVSRRLVKTQQMHWTRRGAHLLLQSRTNVLNTELEDGFRRWCPLFRVHANAALPPGVPAALALRRHTLSRWPLKKGGVPNGRPPAHDAVGRLNRLL
jgi:hypothetical protein